MASPSVDFIQPTSRAFEGMKRILFEPFDIAKWFTLGFTAWLAGLLSGGASGGGGSPTGTYEDHGTGQGGDSIAQAQEAARQAGEWTRENVFLVAGLGSLLLVIVLAIVLALMWVSARGKFMFLDNVVHNRALVKIPWSQFREQGNSLFRWSVGFLVVVLMIVLILAAGYTAIGFALKASEAGVIAVAVLGVFSLILVVVLTMWISVLLESFVIPLMYRDALKATDAWGRFLALHRANPIPFILFVLWMLLLSLGAALCIIVAGVATCCIGFCLMSIPYIGTVLLLPVPVFFRLLGPEFLRQFGPDFDVFVVPEQRSAPA